MDSKPPRGHSLSKRIHQNKFQLKIPTLSKNDGGATITFAQNWNFELKFVLVNPFSEENDL